MRAATDRDAPDGTSTLAVAICTRDRAAMLRRALRSVVDQRRPPDEVLVVDNAPTSSETRRLVRQEHPEIRYATEPAPGLDFARNRALTESASDVVAFLDDDAVAAPDWLSSIEAVLREDPRIAICTGKVAPLALETEGQRLFEANGGMGRGDARISLPDHGGRRLAGLPAPLIAWSISVGAGCSMAVRRAEILQLGGFDEALDLGAALPGGGDVDLIWRALSAGYRVVYEPRVRVWHEHRREVSDSVRQILGHNRATIAMLTKAAARARGAARLEVLAFLLWRLAKPATRVVRGLLGRDSLPLPVLLRLCGACWSGLAAYPAAQRRARALAAARSPT